ncbi:hypothetical protein VTL71DRAFT_9495 [Oculimacula yallundae]|uniref:PLD phosphodiesterase domain-containing protein n=1 Tax=Oculimacula yallundae TaxID=86028 RepID=A0ABR4BS32_9HELO
MILNITTERSPSWIEPRTSSFPQKLSSTLAAVAAYDLYSNTGTSLHIPSDVVAILYEIERNLRIDACSDNKIPNQAGVVEKLLYIHAKVIIVDDRVALIGFADINECSILSLRDFECVAVVRDTDML